MKNSLRITLAQINCIEGDKQKNLLSIERAIKKAYEDQADILVLPEMILTGFTSRNKMRELAESRNGESLQQVCKLIAKYPVHVVYSFPEYVSDNIIYNTTCFIDKNGVPLEYYRKIHLFDEERLLVNRGNEFVEVNVEGIKIGLLTCYDIEFPEASRTLAMKGVKLIIVPTANMLPYDYRHQVFIASRAMENHCFIAYCNRIGKNERYTYHGDSSVIGPDGKALMHLKGDQELIQVCEIKLDAVEESKRIFNYLEERRPELYY